MLCFSNVLNILSISSAVHAQLIVSATFFSWVATEYIGILLLAFACTIIMLLSNFNMYQSALSIVNYLNWREYGTNLVTFSDGSSNMNEGSIKSPNGRKIPTKAQKQKSFFDLD